MLWYEQLGQWFRDMLESTTFCWVVILLMLVCFWIGFFTIIGVVKAHADTASYYTMESCLREGTSGIMANGRRLDDGAFTCASWFYPFGTWLRVTNIRTGRYVLCMVTDRGPSKRLVRKGRTIDLSRAAFNAIANCKQGVIEVEIERVKNDKRR